MDIHVDVDGTLKIKKAFGGLMLETEHGEEMGICMRDTGFEFKYNGEWWEAKNGQVNLLGDA